MTQPPLYCGGALPKIADFISLTSSTGCNGKKRFCENNIILFCHEHVSWIEHTGPCVLGHVYTAVVSFVLFCEQLLLWKLLLRWVPLCRIYYSIIFREFKEMSFLLMVFNTFLHSLISNNTYWLLLALTKQQFCCQQLVQVMLKKSIITKNKIAEIMLLILFLPGRVLRKLIVSQKM